MGVMVLKSIFDIRIVRNFIVGLYIITLLLVIISFLHFRTKKDYCVDYNITSLKYNWLIIMLIATATAIRLIIIIKMIIV